MSKFKEGQWVYHITKGWGNIATHIDYDIRVKFIDGDLRDYKLDGRYSRKDAQPSLFTEEEALQKFGVKRERKMVKKHMTAEATICVDAETGETIWIKYGLHALSIPYIRRSEGKQIKEVKLTGSYEIEVEE